MLVIVLYLEFTVKKYDLVLLPFRAGVTIRPSSLHHRLIPIQNFKSMIDRLLVISKNFLNLFKSQRPVRDGSVTMSPDDLRNSNGTVLAW